MVFRPIVISVSADAALPPCERHGEPVAIGVSCPRAAVQRGDRWILTDQRGRALPVQTTTLDRWGDGSVRWLLVEFQADVVGNSQSYYALAPGEGVTLDPDRALAVEHAGEMLRVNAGGATIDVPRGGRGFLAAAAYDGVPLLRSATIVAEDDSGNKYEFITRRAAVERAGTLRAVIRVDGNLVNASGTNWLDATVRLNCF